ncbi:MAG: hypothetical protein ACI8WB_001761 [Phenylobacterium sp.]
MKKLNRNLANEPQCLANLAKSGKIWKKVTTDQKKEIWHELDKFQHQYCVYCESSAFKGKYTGHIKHFFHKGSRADGSAPHAHLTFDWNNLFGCCAANEHCGHFKDKTPKGSRHREYDPHALIKPDLEDPEIFLQFLPSGKVQAKANLTQDMRRKATETIHIINLQAATLVNARNHKIKLYRDQLLALEKLAMDDEPHRQEYQRIRDEAMGGAHRTAVKHACF